MLLRFNLIEGAESLFDEDGVDCGSLEEAREKAMQAARGIMAAQLAEGYLDTSCRIEVKDEDGAIVLCVPFSDAFTMGRC